jgi:serine/threonine protein kinase
MAWGDSILDVLEYLHGQQPPILFRDLKPNNVMVAADGGLKLIDFGIARAYVGDKTTTYIAGAGTAGYSPVEQFTGGTDPRSDLYAFGATLYTVLTGLVPPMSISMLNGEARLRAVHEVNPAVPRGVQRALDRVMALKRDDRCWDVAEARALLHAGWADTAELPETSPSTIHREASAETVRGQAETVPARPPARRSQAGGGAMLAAALVLIAATALFLWPRGAGVETFRPLYARFVSALDQRASAGALSIMAPDFQARLSPQHGVDRETFIRDQITALSELTDPKVTFEIDSVEARGGEAVVHARRQLRAAYLDPKGRHPITQDVEEDDTWKRSSDGWRWSSSTVRSDRQTMDGRPTQVLSSW